jgi:hypothetical protein
MTAVVNCYHVGSEEGREQTFRTSPTNNSRSRPSPKTAGCEGPFFDHTFDWTNGLEKKAEG